MIQGDLFQTATFSQQDIHASHLVRPGSDGARKMTVTSGRKYLPLCKQSGRVGAFSRMFLDTPTWASTKCYLTWKVKATPSNHLLFQLAPLMPRTDATEYGSLLHTPTATANQLAPSMRNRDAGSWGPVMWATPTAAIAQGSSAGNPNRGKAGRDLRQDVRVWPMSEKWQGGSLNPQWVEWLMGYPSGWTDLRD